MLPCVGWRCGAPQNGNTSGGALLQGRARPAQFDQGRSDACAERVVQGAQLLLPDGLVRVPVGAEQAPLHRPGRLDFDVFVVAEHGVNAAVLAVGEQLHASEGGAAAPVERIGGPARYPRSGCRWARGRHCGLRRRREADDAERVHDGDRVGQFFRSGGLEPGEPVNRHDLHLVRPSLRRAASHALDTCFDRPGTVSSSRADAAKKGDEFDLSCPQRCLLPRCPLAIAIVCAARSGTLTRSRDCCSRAGPGEVRAKARASIVQRIG